MGYYADSVVCDNNDILYVTRTSSSTVYTYNTSGVGQGGFGLGGTNDDALMHSDGVLHKGGNGTTVYTRDIAASSNTGQWSMPSGTGLYSTSDYSPTLGFAWIIDVSNAIQARKFTPNY